MKCSRGSWTRARVLAVGFVSLTSTWAVRAEVQAPQGVAPSQRIAVVSENNLASVHASHVGRRTLLLELGRQAGFKVLFADDLPDNPVDYAVDAQPVAQIVGHLLSDAGTDYVLVLRAVSPGGVSAVIIAKRGLVKAAEKTSGPVTGPESPPEPLEADKADAERAPMVPSESLPREVPATIRPREVPTTAPPQKVPVTTLPVEIHSVLPPQVSPSPTSNEAPKPDSKGERVPGQQDASPEQKEAEKQ